MSETPVQTPPPLPMIQPPVKPPQATGGAEAPAPELTQEQKEFLDALNELIMSAQELSYTVALLPPELEEKYPELKELTAAARNVVRAVYKFHKLIKSRARK